MQLDSILLHLNAESSAADEGLALGSRRRGLRLSFDDNIRLVLSFLGVIFNPVLKTRDV